METYFNIIEVKGWKENLILDLNKQKFYKDSNVELIKKPKNCFINKRNFSYPSIISDSYIKLTSINGLNNLFVFDNLLKKIERLFCKYLVIDLLDFEFDLQYLKTLLETIVNYNIHEIHLLMSYQENLHSDEFGEIIYNSKRIRRINIYDSPFSKNYSDLIYYLPFQKKKLYKKFKDGFNINHLLYSEALLYNTYFNRKLHIGTNGEIKNAPECTESFGNIQDINSHEELKQIVSTPEFQKYWFVKKDETDVCKDCEFRHMCVDNRLPYERSPNEWYHKIECNYNPYIAKWEGEEGYRTLAECGVNSNEEGFSIDHEKIAEINEELWGEDDDNV